ncbi:MAG: hypothetical protein Q8K86_05720 [Candidatus Nanopelagicaceae bacterium]|nr:hypothetical protein [Candidatus Nanopelagicaceae bacterium]
MPENPRAEASFGSFICDNRDERRYPYLNEKPIEDQLENGWIIKAEDLESFHPKSYFITSGEAVAKAEKMVKDAWAFTGRLNKLLNQLKKAKGKAKYLETCHIGDGLAVLAKNPRKLKKKEFGGDGFGQKQRQKSTSPYAQPRFHSTH